MPPEFQGRLCFLAPMTEEHLQDHVDFLSDPEVNRFLRIRKPITMKSQRQWLRRVTTLHTDVLQAVVVSTPAGQRFVGVVHLREIDLIDKTCHSGTLIGDKNYWRMGIATEARHMQLRHAFHDLDLRWVYGRTVSLNLAAQGLLEKTGYKRQGIRPGCRFVEGSA